MKKLKMNEMEKRSGVSSVLQEGSVRYRQLFESMQEGFALHEIILDTAGRPADYRFLDVNPAFERLTGLLLQTIKGRTVLEFLPDLEPQWIERYGRVALEGRPDRFIDYNRSLGKWFEVFAFCPQMGQFACVFIDITERKQAEDAVRRRGEQLAVMHEMLLAITVQHDLPVLLQLIVERAARLLNADGGGLYLCDPEKRRCRCEVSYQTPTDYTSTVLRYGEGAAGTVAQTGQPLIIDDYRTWSGRASVFEDRQPFRALIAMPIIWNGEVTGVIHVLQWETRPFTEADQELLGMFAGHAAIAIENARLLHRLQYQLNELQRAEEALRTSESRYRLIAENMADVIWLMDVESRRFTYISPSVQRLRGFAPEEAMAHSLEESLTPDSAIKARELISEWGPRFLTDPAVPPLLVHEFEQLCKDGSTIHVEVTSTLVRNELGRLQIIGVSRDITERKKTEEELRTYCEMMRTIAEGMFIIGCEDNIIKWTNDKFSRMFGYTPGEMVGMHVDNINAPTEKSPTERRIEIVETLQRDGEWHGEIKNIKKDGTHFWCFVNVSIYDHPQYGKVMVSAHTDITERKRAEEEREQLKQRIEFVLGVTKTGLDIIDSQYSVRYIDPEWQKLYGDPTGRKCFEYFMGGNAVCQECGIARTLATKQTISSEAVLVKEGNRLVQVTTIPFQDENGEWLVAEVNVDITERKRAEEERGKLETQLRQAEKMESVGRLAGGVAHDFNNMLAVIMGHAEFALQKIDPAAPMHESLQAIRSAAQRSAELTSQLLAFARKQTMTPRVVNVNETIAGTLKMLRRVLGEDIELELRSGEGLWLVRVDPTQIDHILTNLSANAREAISGNGKIIIETSNRIINAADQLGHAKCMPGEYVTLTVTDNGCGMDRETLSHLFEPFFTTKDVGKGTGLGLASVYGAVKQSSGFIYVDSEPGRGTTVTVLLPRYLGKEESARGETDRARPLQRGSETILLVEDEKAVLHLIKRILEEQGFRVLAAGTPSEAIRLAKEPGGEIHLLITDVVMPEMNGRDLAAKLLAFHPRLKCIFMSGYTSDILAPHGVLEAGVHFLSKPFAWKELSAKVREALAGGGEKNP
jgi:PAS domain S-box-containing protein